MFSINAMHFLNANYFKWNHQLIRYTNSAKFQRLQMESLVDKVYKISYILKGEIYLTALSKSAKRF